MLICAYWKKYEENTMKQRRYSPQEIAKALHTLHQYNDDVSQASSVLNIPERTLYTWRRKQRKGLLQEKIVQQRQQNEQNKQNAHAATATAQLPPRQLSALGMTKEELIQAFEAEYIPSPYTDLRNALMLHISYLQASISDDPDLAHIRALAISRMLDDVLRLEPLCRVEKPQPNIIKHEYRDGTYHNIPEWSNAVYFRADQAYYAVLMQARREYYELQGIPYDETYLPMTPNQEYDTVEYPTLAELADMHFTIEDFIPRNTGYMAWMENQHALPKTSNPINPADYGFFDEDE
jgi:transposase-like protein